MTDALTHFAPVTREWFEGAFAEPTAAQAGAWSAIARGDHTLVVAPTGSGKTLSAFLSSLDRLARTPDREPGTRVLYVSPLKALAVDVERNLRAPLAGMRQTAIRHGTPPPEVTVGVRSGDTPATERRALVRTPPDILITTPESLFLMLTSAARETLASVDTVIVDEVHSVAGTKRGAHLALSLERLDAMTSRPVQRIGLSATVRPHEEIARFLAGAAPVTIVSPPAAKTWDLSVQVPVEDMTDLQTVDPDDELAVPSAGSIWPHVEERIVDLVETHRSTIVFANSRRLAERLTARLNEIHAERGGEPVDRAPAMPAQVGASQDLTYGAASVLARAHHGSVSKEQRALIEDDLKSGRLRCVVATSSLELGIDMGAVDLVIQVSAPPAVSSGLQRVGRAGHNVGDVSRGVVFPKHRTDLLHCAVTVERMSTGRIERMSMITNPLDVLAQQTVAAAALDPLDVDEWFDLVRRSGPFATLPRSAYESTLDLLAGRYPSDEFAELRPRVVWDRVHGVLTGRPGAQRLAVTSGGTIPDRGLFGVYLVGDKPSRVGELDEEMVYESRVGDVFALGATSWQIEDITFDRVLVTPAFGRPGRLPFWHGDGLGRPAELGEALGGFVREIVGADRATAETRCKATGLDDFATANLLTLLDEQRTATGRVPSDLTLVVERMRDELGDWRLVLHSPYGQRVHAPWALAVGARLLERYGVESHPTAADDGIIVRLPDTDDTPPGAEIFVFEPDEIEALVTEALGGSALFASRFRECAARALLLPRRDPGKRAPLWQQRQRSAQLLDVARRHPTFPILLETVRECLQDVYDLPALTDLLRRVEQRKVRVVDVDTATASPFASAMLFDYVGAFMYEGDTPLAERRAAALSLDPTLLAELLGHTELRELLDADTVETTELELQRLAPDRRVRDAEGVADLLRVLGPLSTAEVDRRSVDGDASPAADRLAHLAATGRVLSVRIAGEERWAAIEDAGRLRDGLGVPLPVGVPTAFTEPVADPVADLVARHARTHGPFAATAVAERFGLGIAVAVSALERLGADRRVVAGEFRPGGTGAEWCDADVLRRLRRRSLAAARNEIEPVSTRALARFLPDWQHVDGDLRGADGLLEVVEQLAGVAIPASALESLVLPSRVRDYSPALLDELTASGEVLWTGRGALSAKDGWVALHTPESAPVTIAAPTELEPGPLHLALLDELAGGGAYFFRTLADGVRAAGAGSAESDATTSEASDAAIADALWELVWSGRVAGDTVAPIRALIGAPTRATSAHRSPRRSPRVRAYRSRPVARSVPPTVTGRFSLVPDTESDPTVRTHALAEQLLDRYGVVTRGAVAAEPVPGSFAAVYKVLGKFEETGRTRRGYFVDGLGGAQFAPGAVVDRLRTFGDPVDGPRPDHRPKALTLAATDPANPYGAALPWPPTEGGHRPGRKAGALVVLVDGELVLFVERGGRTVLTVGDDRNALDAAFGSLAATVAAGRVDALVVEKIDGESVHGHALVPFLTAAGFSATPRGYRIRR